MSLFSLPVIYKAKNISKVIKYNGYYLRQVFKYMLEKCKWLNV